MMQSSTLVETVSINYEDFSESFLTCSTCLCIYDAQEHIPKLLACSHTVCRNCLERIVDGVGVRDAGSFRCPICRETIPLPRGGVTALPPSFLVNQLLDLMARQRREVIPKCSSHNTQELLFCETCDCVFCTICTEGKHGTDGCDHTVIPFSVAIKRMSEILLYKAQLCLDKLTKAAENVHEEIRKLDQNTESLFNSISHSFCELITVVEKRKLEVLEHARSISDEKKRILNDQLALIQSEKEKVEEDCRGLQYQVEVRNITKKIMDLSERIDSFDNLLDPRENAFLQYETQQNISNIDIQESLDLCGTIRTSKTFPALCFATIGQYSSHLESVVTVRTVDYHGCWQSVGGDPLVADLFYEGGSRVAVTVKDNNDGTYEVRFLSPHSGSHFLHLKIFERFIKGSPYEVVLSKSINPVMICGSHGNGDLQFVQPVRVLVNNEGKVFVLDTGNSRIKLLTKNLEYVKDIMGPGLEERGVTGMTITSWNTLLVINWKTKYVTEFGFDGIFCRQFKRDEFVEPTDVAANQTGDILIVDNGGNCIFGMDSMGNDLRKVVKKTTSTIHAISTGPKNEIVVSDFLIRIYSPTGEPLRVIGKKGNYGGVCYDQNDLLLATCCEKMKSCIQIYDFLSGQLLFEIDSADSKLKRPSGLSVTFDNHVIVADLGNNCIKKYRYQ